MAISRTGTVKSWAEALIPIFVHLAWRTHHDDLKKLPFPMLADVKRELTTKLGILDEKEGVALQTDELCPCGWQKGEPVLAV